MILKKILFFALILGCASVKAVSAEERGCASPTVSVVLDKGKPRYSSHPYSELVSLCHHSSILGCTVSEYGCSHKIRLNEKGCKQLDFNCYPVDFQVYIDDEYPEGTCEYDAIKKHEKFHVNAIQNFSKKAVERYLTKCIDEEVKKKKIKTGEEIYWKCAERTTVWMNRKKEEKNDEIDAYKKYHPFHFSKCTGWKMRRRDIEATLDNLVD